ncbi:MAG: PaaI family thioesterase [Proteobacteria bacterium]|nr:PaaI family thioesterase [Pseudomonadota bacterium]
MKTIGSSSTDSPIPLPRYSDCFVCGNRNPIGLDREFFYVDHRIETTFLPGPEHGGYKNTVHGGILATLLDEAMGWTSIISQPTLCVAADLSVRYKLPAKVGEQLLVSAELIADKRRILLTKGKIERVDGTLLCTGEGKYIPLSPSEMKELVEYAQWQDSFYPAFDRIQASKQS